MSTARRIAAGAVGLGLVLTGLSAAPAYAAPIEIQILATNDFHGRILDKRATARPARPCSRVP